MTWTACLASGIIVNVSWSSVSSTVLPLAGVVLGSAGTLLGQLLAQRGDIRRDEAQQAREWRAERKDAIVGFLSAAERTEQYRGQQAAAHGREIGELSELLHAVWLAKKIIELVCSAELAQAAQDYVRELDRCCREFVGNPGAEAFPRQERRLRGEFMELARQEMGFVGEPLRRRSYMGDTRP
jgi:hypothetical protein